MDGEKVSKKKTYINQNIQCENSYFIFSYNNPVRRFCFWLYLDKYHEFEGFILTIIIVNSIKMAAGTFLEENNPDHATFITINKYIDLTFNLIFIGEYLTKSIVMGLGIDQGSFLRDSWN